MINGHKVIHANTDKGERVTIVHTFLEEHILEQHKGTDRVNLITLNKEEAEQLVKELQRGLTE